MVFENLTLFEVHLDGAQFGPKSVGGDEPAEPEQSATEEPAAGCDQSGGRGLPMKLTLVGVLAVAMVLGARRVRSSRQTTVDDYAEDEGGLADSETAELGDIDA